MNILSTITTDVEKYLTATGSDLEKFAAAFDKLFRKAPSALQTVENFIGELAPVVTAAVGLVDPAIEPAAAAALATVETGLAAIQAAATAAVSGTSLVTNLQNFAATVPVLLTGIEVKNPELQKQVSNIVKLVVGECKVLVPAVQSWVAQIKATTAAPVAQTAAA